MIDYQDATNKENNRYIATLGAICLIFSMWLIMFSLFASTDYAMNDQSIVKHFALLTMGILFWLIGQIIMVKNMVNQVCKQFVWIDLFVAIIFGWLFVKGRDELVAFGRQGYLLSYSLIGLGCSAGFFYCLSNIRNSINLRSWFSGMRVKRYIYFILLVCGCIAIVQSGSEPRWDGAYVNCYLNQLSLASISNLFALGVANHLCISYSALNQILKTIIGDQQLGMTCSTIALYLCSIYCVWGILKTVLADRKDLEYALFTLCYAVSPFTLGLSGYHYMDYWVMAMYPIVLYCAMRELWIWHFVVALLMVFVKEPAIVIYGGYCAGYLFVDICKNRSVGHIVKQKKYWGMLAIGLMWIYSYLMLPHWDGVGGFAFSLGYVVKKLKVFFLLNFNWVLALLAVWAIIYLVNCRDRKLELMIPVLISDICFVIFSISFNTVSHARYIDSHFVTLNLLALLGIAWINSVNIRYGIIAIVSLVMLVSNYYTFDPISKKVFKQYDIGATSIISTEDSEYLSDSFVYNQQYRYFDGALNLALRDVVEENAIHYFPIVNDRPWFFDGIYISAEPEKVETQLWDSMKNKRVLIDNENCIPFEVCNIKEDTLIDDTVRGKTGYFYYLPCAGQSVADRIYQEATVLEEKEFCYRGWKVFRIQFRVD